MDRVRVLIEARRKFVVTSDYIGPDRHVSSLRENTAPTIDAPNSLKAKASEGMLDDKIEQRIGSAMMEVNRTKLERQATEIGGLVDLIMSNLGNDGISATIAAFLDRLYATTEDARDRSANTPFDQVSQFCQDLIGVIDVLRASNGTSLSKHIKLLKPLSQAIRTGLNCEVNSTDAAQRISQSFNDRRFFADQGVEAPGTSLDQESRPSALPLAEQPAPSPKPGENRRHLFLLRLFVSRISHLFGDGREKKKVVPRQFVYGFDAYLRLLMGQELYDQLNQEAESLLDEIDSDDDALIWREIILIEQYRRFSFNILVRILIKFKDFSKNKQIFLKVVNRSFDKKVDSFSETHFNIVFMTLFSDIFGLMKDADELAKMDFNYGEGTGDGIVAIYDEFKKQVGDKIDGVYSASDEFVTAAKDDQKNGP
jgi:hypothetical protein